MAAGSIGATVEDLASDMYGLLFFVYLQELFLVYPCLDQIFLF